MNHALYHNGVIHNLFPLSLELYPIHSLLIPKHPSTLHLSRYLPGYLMVNIIYFQLCAVCHLIYSTYVYYMLYTINYILY